MMVLRGSASAVSALSLSSADILTMGSLTLPIDEIALRVATCWWRDLRPHFVHIIDVCPVRYVNYVLYEPSLLL